MFSCFCVFVLHSNAKSEFEKPEKIDAKQNKKMSKQAFKVSDMNTLVDSL